MKKSRALILVNIGTPDKPAKKEVRKFLSQFLNDGRVIDIPWLFRKILVNLVIIPFRVKKTTALYRKLWTDKGSPLLYYMKNLETKIRNEIPPDFDVFSVMRYGKPSLFSVLNEIRAGNYNEIVFLPLFPQFASSTTGSISELVFKKVSKWDVIPSIKFINQFFDHPDYLGSFAKLINSYNPADYDHIVFSFHGLPERQIDKTHPGIDSKVCTCESEFPEYGSSCYKACCYESMRLILKETGLAENSYSIGFQSRMSKNWLSPFTDEIITALAKEGKKKILIIAPSFVIDCLETIVEIEGEYNELFLNEGGEKLTLVKSLNDNDFWVKGILRIALNA